MSAQQMSLQNWRASRNTLAATSHIVTGARFGGESIRGGFWRAGEGDRPAER